MTFAAMCLSGMAWAETSPENASDPSSPRTIRVLSYNIHHAEGTDGKLDLERIAQVIRSSKADVVALQEVDRNTLRTQKVDQASKLAELTEMKHAFGANIALQGGEYGNAVLSKFAIIRSQNVLLPRLNGGEQRGVLQAEIQLSPTDPPLLFFATHFDHRSEDAERISSSRYINQLLTKRPSALAILAGDLNDVPDSYPLKELEKHWQRTNDLPMPTIPVAQPTRQIDFVLVSPANRWSVLETRVLEEPIASDHRPILATLRIDEAEGASGVAGVDGVESE